MSCTANRHCHFNYANGVSHEGLVGFSYTDLGNFRRRIGESNLNYNSMARNLRRITSKKYSPKVTSLTKVKEAYDDPETMEEYGFNLRKTDQFYVNTIEANNRGFVLFASHQIMRMIDDHIPPENRKYMLDGTFDVRPIGGFYQLLIIAIEYKDSVS